MVNFLWENIFRKGLKDNLIGRTLKGCLVFESLTSSERKFIQEIVHERHYRSGESVFRQGDLGVGMYIIAKGSVQISVSEDETNNSESEVVVTRLQEGDFFGELSLFEEGGRRSATAVASEDSVLIGFFQPDLAHIIERNPATGIKIVFRLSEVLSRRLKHTTEKISQLKGDLKDIKRLKQTMEGSDDSKSHITT